ncbi:DUF3889 domain-containing protein [Ferdinandcohnia quinoae]
MIVFMLISGLFIVMSPYNFVENGNTVIAATKKPVPEYAKWGKLAMKETQNKYPQAQIIDYLHMGREINNGNTTERFKLWIRQEKMEFGVFVTITFDTKTEKVVKIMIIETPK